MRIEETTIPNVLPSTIDDSKLVLADNIIQNVYPLFNEVYSSKVDELEKLKKELKGKKKKVITEKNNLQLIMNNYKQKKKVSKLLDRLEKLINAGLVYDGALKHETKILLKIVNRLSDEKLDYHLKDTLQTISKRFSR